MLLRKERLTMPRSHKQNKETIKKSISKLLPKLKGKKPSTRIGALKSIGAFGKDAVHLADKLLPFVSDEDDSVSTHAVQALVDIGYNSPDVVALIRSNVLTDKNQYVRGRGYWMLERLECT